VTFVQRFGGAINLHPHFHSVIPDGLFVAGGAERLEFVGLPPPTPEDVEELALKIARRLTRLVEKLVEDEEAYGGRLEETAAAMQEALAQSLRAPPPADELRFAEEDHEDRRGALRAKVAGFSLHAGRCVAPWDREGLERLCRYGLRAPFSQERLTRLDDGRVVYALRRPWPTAAGVRRLVMEPREFLARLAALVPAPGLQMIRYHGVFANRSKQRALLPAPPPRGLPEGVAPAAEGADRIQTSVGDSVYHITLSRPETSRRGRRTLPPGERRAPERCPVSGYGNSPPLGGFPISKLWWMTPERDST
jgi:hypothetical protein